MKTYKGLWEQLISEENFREAEKKAIRGKSGQRGVRMYMKDPDGKRERLRQQLIAGEYRTGDYVAKLVWEPKERTIYKLRFYPDRLLHHAVMNVLRPILEEKFIQNSYACQTGKGPLAASLKCSEMVRKNRYCLQCDIRKFYPSINQAILSRQMHRIIADKRFMAVLDDIIFSFPGETNIPIGNYTSQWLANYYMTGLDNYILHRLKPKGYIRYNDDFLLFDNDKAKLNRCREEIRDYLQRELALEYSKAELFDVKQGVDFCGYRHFGKYVLIRKSTANRMKRRYREIQRKMASGGYDLDRIEGQVAAGNGLMSHACSGHLRKAIRHDEIWEQIQKRRKRGNRNMKTLVFAEGTELQVEDNSSVQQIRVAVESFAAADTLKVYFTRENMTTIQLGAQEFHEVIPVSIDVIQEENGNITAVFYCQEGIEDLVQNRIDNYTLMLIEEGVL